MKSTPRIRAIIEFVDNASTLYDVCCDHGLIGINALVQKKAERVVFIDVSKPSLDKVSINLNKLSTESLAESTRIVHTDAIGFEFENEQRNCLIIAGIGAHLLVKILDNKTIENQKLILVPHSHFEVLESYLDVHSMDFTRSTVVEKNRPYPIYLVG